MVICISKPGQLPHGHASQGGREASKGGTPFGLACLIFTDPVHNSGDNRHGHAGTLRHGPIRLQCPLFKHTSVVGRGALSPCNPVIERL